MSKSRILFIMLMVITLIGFSSILSAQTRQVSLSNSTSGARLTQNHQYGFEVEFKVGDLRMEEVKTRGGTFDEISIDGYGFSGRIGEPKLPVLSRLIAVPVGASVSFEVVSRSQRTLNQSEARLQNRIVPAQLSISKSEDPATVPFEVKEAVYARDSFKGNELFRVTEAGFMRGVRLFQMEFEPVSYNPVSGELLVNYDVTIQINYNNPDFIATEEILAKTASYEFEQLYTKTIFNWNNDGRPSLVRTPTKLLILTPASFVTTLQPFVDWKIQQGYAVIVTTVGTGGTVTNTSAAIKTYMSGLWSAATTENPAPTYLLIVGDTGTASLQVTASAATVTSPASNHITDNYYVRLQGTDYLPEMYYGRFSVSSAAELTNIVNKTLQFEKTTMPDLSYLGNTILMAGVDANYAPTYGNGQINYGTTHYFNATNGITSNTYLYPASNGAVESEIIGYMNAGRGFINYTAHGSATSWADPTISVTDLNNLTNTNKPFVAVGNCCVTNQFDTAVCFGEALIRAANKAGVAYIGATNNSYWDEDYWWGIGYKTPIQTAAHPYSASTLGAYDAMFHTHGEAVTNWAQTVGETNYMGNLAVEQSTSSMKPYYWEIYSIMGDPSLMPYYGVPSVNTATYPSTILIGATSINVTAVAQSRVALTMGGVLYGTGIVDNTGSLTLTINPFATTGTAKLVITRQNKITIMADVTIAPNSGPYVNVTAATYVDSNNNVAEYNETGRFNVTYQNVGSVVATSIVTTLTCTTPGITITDNTETIATLAAGASTTVNNAYTFNIANNIANGTSAAFTITMVSGVDTWTHNFTLTINAPALGFGSVTIQDTGGNNNGRLDPGETVTVLMPLNNTGAAASPSGSGTLSCATPGITVNTGTANFTAISAAGNASLSFSVSASPSVSVGTVASLVFNATAGAYTANKTESVTVGLIMENFETGNFSSYPWTLGGNLAWTVINTGAYAGTYCAKSGAITHNQTSTMQTTRVLTSGGNITFWYKVSSEGTYDFLKFYVDGVVQGSWSGEVAWTQATYPLTAGTRILKWEYSKDGSVSTGSDCAWVDNIVFPASTAYMPATIIWTPASFSQTLATNLTASQTLTIGNTGSDALSYTISKSVSVTWLSINGGNTYSSSISGGGANQNITIGFNSTGLSAGTYTANMTLTSNSTTNSTVTIPVQLVVSISGSIIAVNPASLSFGNVVVNTSSVQQFTIQNTGVQTLNGTISTPAGYTVALATRNAGAKSVVTVANTAERNILPFSIGVGLTFTYNLTFTPVASTLYNGNVTINSNAINTTTVNLAVTGSGYAPPTALLNLYSMEATLGGGEIQTDMFTICNNGSLNLNYSLSITGSPAWLSCNPMSSIVVPSACFPVSVEFDATGLSAGIYNTTIIVNSNDPVHPSQNITVTLNVYQINAPSWSVATYPNNSATVYGIVTIEGYPAALHDVVGAFVGTECRGMSEVILDSGNAYMTLLANLASEGETVSFQVFDSSANTAYPVNETYALNFGQVMGSPVPVPINGTLQIVLEEPVIMSETVITGGLGLQWNPCPNADEYHIYRCDTPNGVFVQIATTTSPEFTDPESFIKAFYYITAVKNLPGRNK
jgi:hypothetical protein